MDSFFTIKNSSKLGKNVTYLKTFYTTRCTYSVLYRITDNEKGKHDYEYAAIFFYYGALQNWERANRPSKRNSIFFNIVTDVPIPARFSHRLLYEKRASYV